MILTARERFLLHVRVDASGCWIWTGATLDNRNGKKYGKSGSEGAHRVAYRLFKGPVGSKHVLHHCDVELCVRPDHLFLGNAKINYEDSRQKGRNTRGQKVHTAVLEEDQIPEIRKRLRRGDSQYDIADDFGVSQGAISCIARYKTWKHL